MTALKKTPCNIWEKINFLIKHVSSSHRNDQHPESWKYNIFQKLKNNIFITYVS
eukprot:GAHX01008654.1.p1 GENE.GAHX01008654.1~~GAHX01008654.1.p1  ORF type:complete len:54 (+),score=4.28 GAHX01008654.1:78-239(+)